MSILADVAPYSREYNTYRLKVGKQAQGDTELQIEYDKILDRVRQTRESVVRMAHRHFTEPVDEIDGTVDSVSPGGLTWSLRPAGQQKPRAYAGDGRQLFPIRNSPAESASFRGAIVQRQMCLDNRGTLISPLQS